MAHEADPSVEALRAEVDDLSRQVARLRDAQLRPAQRRIWRPLRLALLVSLIGALVIMPVLVLANHQFADVPDSNVFHDDIAAIADAGVTTGCGNGNYCPEDPVTREQMAAFLNRLGALSPGKVPVVNADKLDGLDSKAFVRYGSTLPAGTQVAGTFSFVDTGAPGSDVTGEDDIGFPIPLASAPAVHLINRGDPVPTGCSGNAAAPAASPGNLCVFVTYSSETDRLDGFYSITSGFQGLSSTLGIVVYLHDASGDGFVEGAGTWAVRASGTAAPAAPAPIGGGKGAAHTASQGN